MHHFAITTARWALLFFSALTGPLTRAETSPPQVATMLEPFVAKGEIAGAVAMVVDKEKVLALEAVGFADIAAGKKMAADSLFWIASESKPMTAAAVMMLVDEGKLKLDDPVDKYLPEFREAKVVIDKAAPRPPSHPPTLREMLNHTSGLPFQSSVEKPTLDGLPLAEAVRSYAKTPLQADPGTKHQYSNAGINTAARVLEVVSGQKYEDIMQERLFTPLGMKDTTFWPDEAQCARLALSYKPNAAKTVLEPFQIGQLIYPLSNRTGRYPMPAGGLFATAADVAKFCQMLLNDGQLAGMRYLSAEAVKELTRRQTPPEMKQSYGLGFAIGPDWAGHGGAHATNLEIRPAQGLGLVWMVQHAGFIGEGERAQGTFRKWAQARFAR